VSFEIPTEIRLSLVSDFFAEVTQQIHSLRASGVISFQTASAFGAEAIAFFKSVGTVVCARPFFLIIISTIPLLCFFKLNVRKKNLLLF
jgi:hypothetical protein